MDPGSDPARRDVIRPAHIVWRNGVPYSEDFQDIYHSADGASEVQRVFMQPADVAGRMARAHDFVIGEFGFGTGLNFAVAAHTALELSIRLHFISFEAQPLSRKDFGRITAERRHELPLYDELAAVQPPLFSGWHRRRLADGQITLSLYLGDATEGLDDISGRHPRGIDAWFLDGFAPDRNPALWEEATMKRIGPLSASGATVSTFTAAGRVRRALTAAGFEMRRVDQRPHKRESLTGVMSVSTPSPPAAPGQVDIAGAGIAGAALARHLAEAGVPVTVWDPYPAPLTGGSGVGCTTQHGRLLGAASPQAMLRAHAYHYATTSTASFPGVTASGAMQLTGPNMSGAKMQRIASTYESSGDWIERLDADAASRLAAWPIDDDALWFRGAAVVDLPVLCANLLDHPDIELRSCELPCALRGITVLANGSAARTHSGASTLELADVFGQLELVSMAERPRVPLVGRGYLVPLDENVLAVGATYEYSEWDTSDSRRSNLDRLQGRPHTWRASMRGPRCVTSDRTPAVGRLPWEGHPLYVSTGHGSMGTTSAPFAGAVIASTITGHFEPLTRDALSLLDPQRFARRQARRGIRHGISRRTH